jgi:hypothetical protein
MIQLTNEDATKLLGYLNTIAAEALAIYSGTRFDEDTLLEQAEAAKALLEREMGQ